MIAKSDKIVLTGGAGLVGMNLVVLLRSQGYTNLVVIDKIQANLDMLGTLHPEVRRVCGDLHGESAWTEEFNGCVVAVLLHAQIAGKTAAPFIRNNIEATQVVLRVLKQHAIPFTIDISSSVVNSVADDDYTRTKRGQEKLVSEADLPHCCLRPTLMFGWFDPKHLGWLARFMEKTPIFPIPGHGRYMRQPLYQRDFCRIIQWCIERQPAGKTYDIVGDTKIDYIDIIRTIKNVKGLRTLIVCLPMWFFGLLLKAASLVMAKPPFTYDQMKALTAGDQFTGVDTVHEFGISLTPFADAMRETHCDTRYSGIIPVSTH